MNILWINDGNTRASGAFMTLRCHREAGGTCAIEQRPSASPEAAADRWNMRAVDRAALDAAVAKERERAAKVCEEYATRGGSAFAEWFRKCADEIRKP